MQKDLAIFNRIVNKLLDEEKSTPVLTPIPVAELYEVIDLKLDDNPMDEAAFEASIEKLVLNTPPTSTRKFFNQLFGGRNGKAVIGDMLSTMLNMSMYTYKIGGPMIGLEK